MAAGGADVADTIEFTFTGDFNPTMRVEAVSPSGSLTWRCIGGHGNRDDNTFGFELADLRTVGSGCASPRTTRPS